MPGELIPIIAIIVIFGVPGAIIVTLAQLRHNEKMELIRQGIRPEEDVPRYPGRKSLLWGMLLAGLGFAAVISALWRPDTDLIRFGFLFIGAGVALLVYWKVTAPEREREIRLIEERLRANQGNSPVILPGNRPASTSPEDRFPESGE